MKYDTALPRIKPLKYIMTFVRSFPPKIQNCRGFTLVEILIVMGIIALLTSLSIAAYSTYTRNQKFNNAVNDTYNMLQVAKSRASSQYVPSDKCTYDAVAGYVFEGYQVTINASSVDLSVRCNGAVQNVNSVKIPSGILTPVPTTIVFKALDGTVNTSSDIVLTFQDGNIKRITIPKNGKITISN